MIFGINTRSDISKLCLYFPRVVSLRRWANWFLFSAQLVQILSQVDVLFPVFWFSEFSFSSWISWFQNLEIFPCRHFWFWVVWANLRLTSIITWNRKWNVYLKHFFLSGLIQVAFSLFSVASWVTKINEKFYSAEFQTSKKCLDLFIQHQEISNEYLI